MKKIKVLYIEDEPALGRIVKESLESRDFEVNMAADGGEAIAAFIRTKPDICVLDIMLPEKDGYTIAREIRRMSPTVPIIFLTAKTQTEDLLKGFESGGNDYIHKPFSMEELIVRIGNLLQLTMGQASASPDIITIGKYCFFPLRYELQTEGETRKLSYREANLLMILIENRNALVKRKDILMRIWGDDSFFNSRNLDVYIAKLREHFKKDPTIEIITIKGVGYHFLA
ncbi:MAG TPA: response regulator transcription factor [Anseongella sp.]|nr:response regulator transcription factor [Anseongella sp.]